jgi:hypothetical protein
MGHRHSYDYAKVVGDQCGVTMQDHGRIRAATVDLDLQRLEDIEAKGLDHCFLRAPPGRQVKVRLELLPAVLELTGREERCLQPCGAVEPIAQPRGLDQVDPDVMGGAHPVRIDVLPENAAASVAVAGISGILAGREPNGGRPMPIAAPSRQLTVTDVTALTIDLLADLQQVQPEVLARQLSAAGGQMPVDSLDMFDILQEFRNRTGLTLPVRKLKRDTLRSIRAFAEFVTTEAQA